MRRAYCAVAEVWMDYLLWDEIDLARWPRMARSL
jgi:hypothetical protein